MGTANKHAFTLKAQLQILLFLRGDVYRPTHDIHKLIKAAYMNGAKMEARKHEPVRVGGE